MNSRTDLSEKKAPLNMDQKKFLLDPVTYFLKQEINDLDRLITVKELYQERCKTESELRIIKTKTSFLSKQIGDAKRNKLPTDKLIANMQALSRTRKIISKKVVKNNQDILKNFIQPITLPVIDSSEKRTNMVNKQRYPSTPLDLRNVSIYTFDFSNNQDEWNQYVSGNLAASIHHRYEWRDILVQSYDLESHYLCARNDDGNIVGILPMVYMTSRIFSNKLVSMPFFQRGGAIADSPSIELQLIQAAVNYGLKIKVDYAEFRDDISRDNLSNKFFTQNHKVHMILSLPISTQELLLSFPSKLRAQIKRPQRENYSFKIGNENLIDDFYLVYSRNMRDLGSPAHHKSFIRNILINFPHESKLAIIYLDNKPVGGGLLLGAGNTLEIPLASTIKRVNHLSMNMLLYWKILCYAIDSGYELFDFGRSTRDAATYRFKRQWGAEPKQLYWNHWLPNKEDIPTINPKSLKYQAVIWLWKNLPIGLANFLGPKIIRYIP